MTATFPTTSGALTTDWLSDALGTRLTRFEIEPLGLGVGPVWVRRWWDARYPEGVSAAFVSWWERVQEICEGLIPPTIKALGDRFTELIPTLMARLSEPPWTLSHGDYRLDNLFFSDDPARPLVAIDWQLHDRSRGPRDLSYLLSQSMEPDLRAGCERALVERYVSGLVADGVTGYGVEQAWHDYPLPHLFHF